MSKVLDGVSWLVTAQPLLTLLVLLVVTIVLGVGITRMAPQADNSVFLPDDSEVAQATETIDEMFGSSLDTIPVTLIFRGNALTPEGLAQIDAVLDQSLADPRVASRLTQPPQIVSPTFMFGLAMGAETPQDIAAIDFSSLTQQQIDQMATQLPVGLLISQDADGTGVAVANIRLLEDADGDGDTADDEDSLAEAELFIRDTAKGSAGPLEGSSLSQATTAEETEEATGTDMMVLMIIALAVIAALLLLFTRSIVDLFLSIIGLVMTIIWVIGAQGWLGPNGAGIIGAPNTLTTMVPIMLIGLVVDYAIQTVGLYREQRGEGHDARTAARLGLRSVLIPLSLAAVTTIVSFLTNLSSPIPANSDFGIVSGIGVAVGLIVMLALLASARALIDRWRERRGSLGPANLVSGAIPGVGPAVEALGVQLARRPAPFLIVIGIITIVLGVASTNINTEFDSRDFLPAGGDAIRDVATLDAAFGGSTDSVKVLVESEVTSDRTVRNLLDFTDAFGDDLRRPAGVVTGIQSSLGLLLFDWITDDGEPGDVYDAQLQAMTEEADQFRLNPQQVQAVIDRLEELDPEGFAQVAVDNPNGADTMLITFDALTRDQERAERMVADIEGLWFGRDEEIVATSGEIVGLEVVDAMTSSQTAAIATTVLAALIILSLFFWITEGRAELGFIAVAPIVMVLFCVLGTMALTGIPYNVITALITALSIGIGVDYTIHIIHRYEEEFAHSHDPEEAARRTLGTTGSALVGSALTTALGFGVLIFSSLTPFQQFGIVTAITIAYALIAAIVVVPPAMILWAAYQNYRLRRAVERASALQDE